MEQIFRLREGTARTVGLRSVKLLGIILAVAGFFNVLFVTVYLYKNGIGLSFLLFYILFCVGVFALVAYITTTFLLAVNENLYFKTDAEGISRIIDMDGKSLSFFNQWQWSNLKTKGSDKTFIAWKEIASIKDVQHSLEIQSANKENLLVRAAVTGQSPKILVPKELQNFEQLESILKKQAGLSFVTP